MGYHPYPEGSLSPVSGLLGRWTGWQPVLLRGGVERPANDGGCVALLFKEVRQRAEEAFDLPRCGGRCMRGLRVQPVPLAAVTLLPFVGKP